LAMQGSLDTAAQARAERNTGSTVMHESTMLEIVL